MAIAALAMGDVGAARRGLDPSRVPHPPASQPRQLGAAGRAAHDSVVIETLFVVELGGSTCDATVGAGYVSHLPRPRPLCSHCGFGAQRRAR
jgi:hypothetical protein